MQRRFGLVVAVAVFPFAWLAPGARFDWQDTAVALVLAAIGATTILMDRRSPVGALLALAGCTWLFGNLVASSSDVLSSLGGRTIFLHRAVLTMAALYVLGRPHRRGWWLLGVAFGLALWPSAMRTALGAAAWSTIVIVTCVSERIQRPNATRLATIGSLAGIGTLALAVAARWYGAQYRFGVIAAAAILAVTAVVLARDRERLTDVVTEHMGQDDVTLQAALARALGDSTVEVTFATGTAWVDEAGLPVGPPEASPGRRVVVVESDGTPIAALVHDAMCLDDPSAMKATVQAVRLASEHVLLRSQLQAATEQAIASRRRVAAAASVARERFAVDYRSGPGAALAAADRGLTGSAHQGAVTAIREEVERLLDGLGPLASSGGRLVPALQSLSRRSPVRVDLDIEADVDSTGSPAEALWFVCSEGLSNVAKHSGCDCATVHLFRLGNGTAIEVADRGAGGAAVNLGTGLQGLRDRVTALGGWLRLESLPSGTRLLARVPDE